MVPEAFRGVVVPLRSNRCRGMEGSRACSGGTLARKFSTKEVNAWKVAMVAVKWPHRCCWWKCCAGGGAWEDVRGGSTVLGSRMLEGGSGMVRSVLFVDDWEVSVRLKMQHGASGGRDACSAKPLGRWKRVCARLTWVGAAIVIVVNDLIVGMFSRSL